jgi:predicted PhzF superfamily epimerase YddE/YHI9
MTREFRVRSFANPQRGLAGNVCNLHFGDHAPAITVSGETHCHVRALDSRVHDVSCHVGGQSIQCCGHGLLAAAAMLFRITGRDSACLAMNGSLIEAERQPGSDLVWIAFSTAAIERAGSIQLQRDAAGLADLLGLQAQHITDMATSGGDDGYLVLRMRDGFDLTTLSPPGQALADFTRRALIATTLLDRGGGIGLRYFAPRHGVGEDTATGSGMRILAGYWSNHFDQLWATQFSPAGGELFSRIAGTITRIGGRVVTEA